MDGYRDIHPWPYHWSRDIGKGILPRLTLVRFVYENADFWTYNNHVSLTPGPDLTPPERIVDIYWRDDRGDRLQLPPPIGDHITQLILADSDEYIRGMIWFGRIWTLADGWYPWTGPQGDFVDHIHIEFNERINDE